MNILWTQASSHETVGPTSCCVCVSVYTEQSTAASLSLSLFPWTVKRKAIVEERAVAPPFCHSFRQSSFVDWPSQSSPPSPPAEFPHSYSLCHCCVLYRRRLMCVCNVWRYYSVTKRQVGPVKTHVQSQEKQTVTKWKSQRTPLSERCSFLLISFITHEKIKQECPFMSRALNNYIISTTNKSYSAL